MRPGDFRRPIERALQLGGGIAPASYFSGIVGAAACVRHPRRCDLSRGITTGTNTVTFHLSRPDPEFLYKLALPTADAEPADTALKPRLPLPATGPYMVTRFDPSISCPVRPQPTLSAVVGCRPPGRLSGRDRHPLGLPAPTTPFAPSSTAPST